MNKLATLTAAVVTFALSAPVQANDWWDDGDDGYRHTGYDERYADRDDDYGYDDYDDDYRDGDYRHGDGYVYARVVDVEPVFRQVRIRRPQRECWDEQVVHEPRRRHRDTATATVTGGLIGGAIGRQFGDGKGRDAMTLVGTLIGSAMAHDNADRANHRDYYGEPRYRTIERCTTRVSMHEERRVDGYHVTYSYAGREYTTRTARNPGDRIRVRVAVTPAGYERY